MENIRNRVTIPVNFTARKSIKSEVAKALYNRVDSLLAKMDKHEKIAIKLIDELSLKTSRYQYKSQRKAFVETLMVYRYPVWMPSFVLPCLKPAISRIGSVFLPNKAIVNQLRSQGVWCL